jgi:hypothetical protein
MLTNVGAFTNASLRPENLITKPHPSCSTSAALKTLSIIISSVASNVHQNQCSQDFSQSTAPPSPALTNLSSSPTSRSTPKYSHSRTFHCLPRSRLILSEHCSYRPLLHTRTSSFLSPANYSPTYPQLVLLSRANCFQNNSLSAMLAFSIR